MTTEQEIKWLPDAEDHDYPAAASYLGLVYDVGWVVERVMVVPMVSTSPVRMLAEGIAVPLPPCAGLPEELRPRIAFSDEQIRRGLPPPKRFGFSNLLFFQK